MACTCLTCWPNELNREDRTLALVIRDTEALLSTAPAMDCPHCGRGPAAFAFVSYGSVFHVPLHSGRLSARTGSCPGIQRRYSLSSGRPFCARRIHSSQNPGGKPIYIRRSRRRRLGRSFEGVPTTNSGNNARRLPARQYLTCHRPRSCLHLRGLFANHSMAAAGPRPWLSMTPRARLDREPHANPYGQAGGRTARPS